MHDPMTLIAAHGYLFLVLFVFLESVGLPVPAALALLAAGAASANGTLHFGVVFSLAVVAALGGDLILYMLGKYTGWWFLGVLCRLSANPESCILRSADSFYKHGRVTVVFAKFVPGLNSLAAPLAGSMRMPLWQFAALDLTAAALYSGVYLAVGYLFSGWIDRVERILNTAGHFVLGVVALAALFYAAHHVRAIWRARIYRSVPRVRAAVLASRLADAEGAPRIVVADVRSHGYYDAGARRIRGSIRLEPNKLPGGVEGLSKDTEIFLYCTCARQATSSRVAHLLAAQGYKTSVITGGLRDWVRSDLPTEIVPGDDFQLLPSFGQ